MKKIIKTILWFAWLVLIFYLSNENGTQSSDLSNGILLHIANFFKISDVESFVSTFGFIIRKGAHFSEYFILYILTIECFKEYKVNHLVLISILFCVLYASFDEFHQLFIDGRCGQFKDVLIDSSGSLCSLLFWHLIKKDGRKSIT